MQGFASVKILTLVVVLAALCHSVSAQQVGTLHLVDLPPGALVYVDGKAVKYENGRVPAVAGWHEVQVEVFDGQVMALRRRVEVQPGRIVEVWVRDNLLQVYATGKAVHRAGPPGPPGPGGPGGWHDPGPQERVDAKDMASLRAVVEGRVENRLDEISTVVDRVRNEVRDEARGVLGGDQRFYWYDPDHETTFVDVEGPAGPLGPAGRSTVDCNSTEIVDDTGRPILDSLVEKLNLTALKTASRKARERVANLPVGPPPPLPRLTVLTPRFRDTLEKAKIEALQAGSETFLTVEGPPGPDATECGDLFFKTIRLSKQDTAYLLDWLEKDPGLQQQIATVRSRLDDIDLWAAEIEEQAKRLPAAP